MNTALGQWIATLATQRIDQNGETPIQALTWVQEWVDIREGAYRALGAPYGDDEDSLLRWLCMAKPTSRLRLKPDRELIRLFRAHHQMHTPIDGGDVVVEHRLAVHGPSVSAKAMTQYRWLTPIVYTMTLVVLLPDALPWLRPVLAAGRGGCSCAPRPDLGLLWLPAPAGLTVTSFGIAILKVIRKSAKALRML